MRKESAILEDTSVADYEKELAKAKADVAEATARLAELEARKPTYFEQIEEK